MSGSWWRSGVLGVLAAGVFAVPAQATPPGTNGRIAFITAATPFQVETIEPDGSQRSGPLVTGLQPAWSPDGTRIAYVASTGGISQIFVMNADGSGQTQVTHETTTTTAASWPAWSPDGKRIAFTRDAPNNKSQLAVIDADGSAEAALTPVPAALLGHDESPAWSPDGTKIAFDRWAAQTQTDVWVMNADGSGATQLTHTPDPDDGGFSSVPRWSPDGTRIAFATNQDNLPHDNNLSGSEIYVMNADGSSPVRLTHDDTDDVPGSWSPDGKQIVYGHTTVRDRDPGSFQLFAVNADGSGAHKLLDDAASPDWQTTEPDSDGDGLPDDWETKGVDTPAGHLDLPGMGADPQHKDVFVELDTMPGDPISQGAIDAVVAAFATAPLANPDGTTGIDLHVDNGPGSTMNPRTGAAWGARSEQDAIPFTAVLGVVAGPGAYDWSAFDALRAQHFSPVREPAFHYVISAQDFNADQNSGIARGIPGSDFLVTLGSICNPVTPPCTQAAQAGTFMHELGHNLGLRHGGGDSLNDKPNYLSIMNYTFQFTGVPQAGGTLSLDYSRAALPTLDESQLGESTGIGGPAGLATLGTCSKGPRPLWPLSGPVDFDCDGTIASSPVIANINGDCVTDANGNCTAARLGPLPGFDDWAHVDFTGGGIGLLGAPAPPAVTQDDEPPITQLITDAQAIEHTTTAPAPVTPPTPATAFPVPAPTPKPRAKKLVLSHLRIHPARVKHTATVSYRLSAAGKVRFTLTPCHTHCTFTRTGHTGTNTFRLRIRSLKPGRHRLHARPQQSGAKTATVSFRVHR
jgi:Tol biopolymer transport system component